MRYKTSHIMNKLCIGVSVTVFSWIGWWLGAKVGIGTAFAVSTLMSLLGVYVGWRINRDLLS